MSVLSNNIEINTLFMVNNKLIMLALFGVLFSISYSIVGHAQARCWSQIDTFYKQNKTNLYEKAVDLIVPGEFDSRGDKQLIRTIDLYSFINKENRRYVLSHFVPSYFGQILFCLFYKRYCCEWLLFVCF